MWKKSMQSVGKVVSEVGKALQKSGDALVKNAEEQIRPVAISPRAGAFTKREQTHEELYIRQLEREQRELREKREKEQKEVNRQADEEQMKADNDK